MSFKKLFRSMLTRSLRAPKSSPARRPQRSLGRQLETLEDRTVPALLSLYQAEGNALDSEGTNNGTLNNGVAFTTGVFGQAFNFDGVNDYVSTTRQIQNDFSIAAWIKTTAAGVGTQFYHGNPVITAEVGGVTNDFGTTIINGKFAFGVGAPDQTIQSTTTVNDGNWHHVVAERQGTTIRVYVDGNLETSLTGTHSGALNANANITFGGDLVNGIFYPGALDDVRIYDEAIPQSAISILAQRGQTTTANFKIGRAHV